MLTDVQIINLGLSKIASSRIVRLDPAATPLEKYMATNYPHWKRTELSKRRWVFATVDNYQLTLNATLTGVAKPYKFALPIDCLRPIRNKYTEWVQRGRYLYSACATLKISYIKNVAEAEFDQLFDEVMACKVAKEACEYVTQSNTKVATAEANYRTAISEAGQANAFVTGPEDIQEDDAAFSWVLAHQNGM